ncbi:MAG: pyrroline-5-carboxylate reductase [Planctomycetota bacterium]
MRYKLGFIGCGNMAQAIAGGAIKGGVLQAPDVIASDPSASNRAVFEGWGCDVSELNGDVVARAQQVLLAVKPQVFPVVAADLDAITDDQVLISIMAGISSAGVTKHMGRPCRVVRVMPNTPALVGAGMAGIAMGDGARPGDDELSKRLFAAVGEVVCLKEPMIDAINAISGSGPGYVFYFAEALEDAAAELGLGGAARRVIAQTFFGAGKLMLESGEGPAELRGKVTSPGGTTLAATDSFDHDRVKEAIRKAVRAAFTRAQELGA